MEIAKSLFDILYAFGPSIGYGFQYNEIEVKNTSEGFSPLICVILLISMIARIYYWVLVRFGTPVLIQAIVLGSFQVFNLLPRFYYSSNVNVLPKQSFL